MYDEENQADITACPKKASPINSAGVNAAKGASVRRHALAVGRLKSGEPEPGK
jgi:hypothetical protein